MVENAFADYKQFRGLATRYCKLACTFAGLVNLVGWYIGTKQHQRKPSRHGRMMPASAN